MEDCASFLAEACENENAIGKVINAGLGQDVSINKLAELVSRGRVPIVHIEHHHPQSEIQKLLCDPSLANELLGWKPMVNLDEGIRRMEEWLRSDRAVAK